MAPILMDKVVLITGGTGSFGNAVLRKLLDKNVAEIRIFSRDEKKQDDMRKKYNNPKIKFYIGDVRSKDSLTGAMRGVDYVFHAAALKQVPSCEFYPMEAIATNVLGTSTVLDSAIENGVTKFIGLSTDKAVYPVNAMGMSKALMEKVIVAKSRNLGADITICATRYGNVMASRGSVIPLFIEQIVNKQPITITDPKMTRFMMSLDEAVDLVLYAFEHAKNGDIFVQKSPAVDMITLVKSVKRLLQSDNHPEIVIGTRHGEKVYETLLSREEMVRAISLERYFRVPADDRDLNYNKYFEEGRDECTVADEYHSHNAERLTVEQMVNVLECLPEINEYKRYQNV